MAYATEAQFRDYHEQVPTYAKQTVTVSGSPTGGTFTLSFQGTASGAIAYNATAAAVRTALEAHADIDAGEVKVSGPAGGPWVVDLSGDPAESPLSLGTNLLTGGSSPTVAVVNTTAALIATILTRATAIVERYLGFSYAAYTSGTNEVVYGTGTDYLLLPAVEAGSVTLVSAPSGYDVPDYIEQDGILIVEREDILGPYYGSATLAGLGYAPAGGWQEGVPYTVRADWGQGEAPADIVHATLEIAVWIWQARAAGFSSVVGVEGSGEVGYNGAFPKLAQALMDLAKEDHAGTSGTGWGIF